MQSQLSSCRRCDVLVQVPDCEWFCEVCSNKYAEEGKQPYQVGRELRCQDCEGNYMNVILDSMSSKGALIHWPSTGGSEWVTFASNRLETIAPSHYDVEEDDEDACEVRMTT